MADAAAASADPAPAKKGLLARLLVPLLLLVGGAAAGAAGAIFAPTLMPQAADAEGAKKPKPPKLEVAPLEYVELPNSFTANLKDSGRFVQVKIAVSTQGGQPVVEAVERHRVAIVAAVLGILSDTNEEQLHAPGGRDALARSMRIAINDVLQRKSGIAGVDDVFFTSFVLQ
ncbi:MAG: flagellar basal body-associated FliL family protein [Sandaracinobacteroides sp.]